MHVFVHELQYCQPQCCESRQRKQWTEMLQKYLKYINYAKLLENVVKTVSNK